MYIIYNTLFTYIVHTRMRNTVHVHHVQYAQWRLSYEYDVDILCIP